MVGLEGVSGGVFRQAGQAVGEFISLAGMDFSKIYNEKVWYCKSERNEAFYNTPSQRTFSYTFDFG